MSVFSLVTELLRELPGALEQLPRRFERSGLSLHEFTCVLPLKRASADDHALSSKLRELDEAATHDQQTGESTSTFARVPGIHSARLLLFGDTEKTDQTGRRPLEHRQSQIDAVSVQAAPGPLVLNLVYDGALADVLLPLLEPGGELRRVLAYCEGFPAHQPNAAIVSWLNKARLRGSYFFSDIPDQTRTEIDESATLWRAFQAFYQAHQAEQSTKALRDAFEAFWREQKQVTVPISRYLERRLPDEDRWARRGAQILQRVHARSIQAAKARGEPALRVIHAKHHGLLEAEFQVLEQIPERLRRGVFEQPKTFRALIRLSNSAPLVRADAAFDGRGMAIKLLDVPGERAWTQLLPRGTADDDERETQDFVLIDQPNFFSSDVEDFAVLLSGITGGGWATVLGLPLHLLRRRRSLSILLETLLQRVNHPLDPTYHSATPYLLGELDDPAAPAVKYSVRPVLGRRKTFCRARPNRSHPNFLSKELVETLHVSYGETVELEFRVHVSNGPELSVEDATASWRNAQVVPVAKIVIRPQEFATSDKNARCEQLHFTPWHALALHRPLGSLNRARLFAYRQSARLRRAANAAREQPEEPPETSSEAVGPPGLSLAAQ